MHVRNVAVLIFDAVEVLDFCGPFEVFSVAGGRDDLEPFHVYTVAQDTAPVTARGGLSVNPRYGIHDCPPPDIVVVPGGYGTRHQLHNTRVIDWIAERAKSAELVLSVCTGALLLAKAGLLEGSTATTHHLAIDLLRELAPRAHVDASRRIADNGRVVLSAGISAGLDMALHVVERLLGPELARETAGYMEYDWKATA